MPTNNMDTIFNSLQAAARKKELNNSDKKEISRRIKELADTIPNITDKQLSQKYLNIYKNLQARHADAVAAAEDALNEEQKNILAAAVQTAENNAEIIAAGKEQQQARVEEAQTVTNEQQAAVAEGEPQAAAPEQPAPAREQAAALTQPETPAPETAIEANNTDIETIQWIRNKLQEVTNNPNADTTLRKGEINAAATLLASEIKNGYKLQEEDNNILKSSIASLPPEQQQEVLSSVSNMLTSAIANRAPEQQNTAESQNAQPRQEQAPEAQPAEQAEAADQEPQSAEQAAPNLGILQQNVRNLTDEDMNTLDDIIARSDNPRAVEEAQRMKANYTAIKEEQERAAAANAPENNENADNNQAAPNAAENAADGQAPAEEGQAEAAPQSAEEKEKPLTEEEVNKYMDEVRASGDINAYMATISPKLSEENIIASMSLEPTYYTIKDENGNDIRLKDEDGNELMSSTAEQNRATALANPDDMLVAVDYYEKQGKFNEIEGTIAARLAQYNAADLTPDNAYVLLALADKIKGSEQYASVYNDFTAKLAEALRSYDKENMGSLNEEQLRKNYEEAHQALAGFVPQDENGNPTLDAYSFTNDNGKEFKSGSKKRRKTEQAVLDVARELAAQELAKTGLDPDPKKRADQMNKIMNDKVQMLLHDPEGKKTFNQSEMAARMAAGHTKGETFKNRLGQRFKNSSLGKAVTSRLEKLDKQLTEVYGQKYVKAKKVTKTIAKIGWSSAKSAALFAVAGLANPVGVPALIAYNTVKQWKGMKKQLNDPSISKGKKAAMVLGAAVTTSLGMVTAATGLSGITDALGVNTPAVLQFATNAGNTLGVAGRTAISTLAATVPNWIENRSLASQKKALEAEIATLGPDGKPKPEVYEAYKAQVADLQSKIDETKNKSEHGQGLGNIAKNFFGINKRKLKKLEGQMKVLETQKPRDMAAINKAMKDLEVKRSKNKNELLNKTLGSAIGIGISSSGIMPSAGEWAADKLHQMADTVTDTVSSTVAAVMPDNQNGNDMSDTTTLIGRSVYDPEGLLRDSLEAQIAKDMYADEFNDHGAPDELSGMKSHEANLADAKAENSSGLEGKSAYAHTLQHLESLGDSRIADTNAMAEDLCERIGPKANLATIACKMAPYALQDALGLEGLPGDKPTSYNMLNHLASNDLTPEQQKALDSFIEKNFDGTRFKTENFADYNRPAQPSHEDLTAQIGKGVQDTIRQNTGNVHPDDLADLNRQPYHFEPVDHLPGQQPVTVNVQTVPRTEVQTVYTEPVYAATQYYGGYESQEPLAYDAALSRNLSDKYIGAFRNLETGEIVYKSAAPDYIPDRTCGSAYDAMEDKRMGINAYDRSGDREFNREYGMYAQNTYISPTYAAAPTRVLQGTGTIVQVDENTQSNNNFYTKIDKAFAAFDALDRGLYAANNALGTIDHGLHVFKDRERW